MKKILIALIIPVLIMLSFIKPANANWEMGGDPFGFEQIIKTCSSFSTYNNMLPTCNNNGFSYPTLEVKYDIELGGEVNFTLKQIKLSSMIVDHYISSAVTVKCDSCGDVESAILSAYDGLKKAAQQQRIKVRNKNKSDGNGFSTAPKEILVNTSSNFINTWVDKIWDKEPNNQTQSPHVVVVDMDGKPIGSGAITNGKVKLTVKLKQDNGSDKLFWSGDVSRDIGNSIYDSWEGFTFTGGTTCRVTYTGSRDMMSMMVVCY